MKIELVYHGIVVSKKNSKIPGYDRRTGKQFVAMNPRAKANQNDMIMEFQEQLGLGLDASPMIMDPCEVHIKLYEPNLQRRDIDNQATSILDALVTARVIENDDIKHVQMLHVVMAGIDKEDPRAEITIKLNHETTTENRK